MVQTAIQAGRDKGGRTVCLRLGEAFSGAVRGLPDMMRGAGLVLVLTSLLFALTGILSGTAAGLALLVALVAWLAAFGAVTRIGLFGLDGARQGGLGPGGLQLRRLEGRLLGATLLVALFMAIILSILGLTALALSGAAGLNAEAIKAGDWARVGPPWKLVLLTGVGLIVLLTPVVFLVRLSLYAQATAVWGRMTSLAATRLTNGAMAPLLIGLLACAAPLILWMGLCLTAGWDGTLAGGIAAALLMLVQTPMAAGFLGRAWHSLGREEGE